MDQSSQRNVLANWATYKSTIPICYIEIPKSTIQQKGHKKLLKTIYRMLKGTKHLGNQTSSLAMYASACP